MKKNDNAVKVDSLGNAQKITDETILQLLDGTVADLIEAPDPAFASGSMGQGMVIYPTAGEVFAPVNGVVSMLFKTKHAIGIISNQGLNVMIHIGIDTVKLNGKYFVACVQQGDIVQAGQLLIKFDLQSIKKAGFDPATFVIVTNSNDYQEISLMKADKGLRCL
ncbi:PTS glucose transporter subunit IIA [Bombilactobacillus folatiphilus]|uniref:PTS glucose transporter subunit IIA n=1 Tax=Bombilactobacillus folatiphilus TaxID=2923362 RepID=A0ABY4PBJ7_9LACO|nr:PTS glucose transporter subunit IIA [Bombilactobacillus folatiphilus]UQS82632.1 PTS glucose transporter subunit IIA [Bombilactobacillus folatiphilus]